MIRVAAMLAFMGALTGFSASLLLPRHFVGTATAVFPQPPDNAGNVLRDAFARTMGKEELLPLIVRSATLSAKLDYTPMEEELETVRAGAAAHVTGPDSFAVQFTDDDRDEALDMAKSLTGSVSANVAKLEHADPSSKPNGRLSLEETGLTTRILSFTGFIGGLLLAALIRTFHK